MSGQDEIERLHEMGYRAYVARIEDLRKADDKVGQKRLLRELRRLDREHFQRLAALGWDPEEVESPRTPVQRAHMAWYWRCFHGICAGTLARWEDEGKEVAGAS